MVLVHLHFSFDDHGTAPTDALLIPVATPIYLGRGRERVANAVWCYSIVETVTMTVVLWTATDRIIDSGTYPSDLAIATTVTAALKCCGTCFLMSCANIAQWSGLHFQSTKEKSDLRTLLSYSLFPDALELIMFSVGSISGAMSAVLKDAVKFTLIFTVYLSCCTLGCVSQRGVPCSFLTIALRGGSSQKVMEKVWDQCDNEERIRSLGDIHRV